THARTPAVQLYIQHPASNLAPFVPDALPISSRRTMVTKTTRISHTPVPSPQKSPPLSPHLLNLERYLHPGRRHHTINPCTQSLSLCFRVCPPPLHRGWVFVAWQRRCKTSRPPGVC
ncbi:unnamed protein product, partial [Ectocarpus sp. 8 AP-2014]